MCKLLVIWSDNGSYGAFDVVDVREDTVEWGGLEGYPNFLRVSLPGITVEQAKFLMEVQRDPTGSIDYDSGKRQDILYKRGWKIKSGNIPPPLYAQIEAAYLVSGEYEITDADGMLAWLEKKIDGSGKGSW